MRKQIRGPDAIEAALDAGEPVRVVLLSAEGPGERARAVADRCRRAGVAVLTSRPAELWRLTAEPPAAEILAVVGPDPEATLDDAFAQDGCAWLFCGLQFPGNTGFALRTAEVSGATAAVVDNGFGPGDRRRALRASMGADRFFPVFWEPAASALEAARRAGMRVLAVEDVGASPPWEADLTGRVLFVLGGEHDGVPVAVLDHADQALRIPMRGFIPAYNLQAAMAAVVGERLRQSGK